MYQYVIIRTDIPLGHQLNCCAHAAALATAKFINDKNMPSWLVVPYSITVEVTGEETLRNYYEKLGENNAFLFIENDLDNQACSLATRPQPKHEYPQWIRELPLAHDDSKDSKTKTKKIGFT